jgi:phosphate transport system substrate-binding protein
MKRLLVCILSAVLVLGALAGCAATNAQPSASPSPSETVSAPASETLPASSAAASVSAPAASPSAASGKLSVVGSTSVGPLMEKIAAEYNKKNPGLTIDIQQVGSSAGIQAAIDGSADIGMSSRDLTADETAQGLKTVNIALDGIAVILNKDNPISALTTEQIQKVFSGEVTNWKDVGGKDGAITVIAREEGSGTRSAFEELMKLQKEVEKDGKKVKESTVTEKALVQQGSGAVKAGVAQNPNAVGYLSLGLVDDTIKAATVDGVACTVENVKNKTYKVSRPFVVLTKGDAAGAAKEFIDYMLSDEVQKLVEEEHYITIK